MEPQNKSSIGSIIGTVIIIAIIILGGLYFWGKRIEESKANAELVSEASTTQTNESENVSKTSSSDDLDSIDADLEATNLNDLDAEMNAQAQ